jgi:hypothetical protein
MPTVLRLDGLRVVVYPNDHRPPTCMSSGPAVKRCSSRRAGEPQGKFRVRRASVAERGGGVERGAPEALRSVGDDPWR